MGDATIEGLFKRIDAVEIDQFAYSETGKRRFCTLDGTTQEITIKRIIASRRMYRWDSLSNIRVCLWLGLTVNPVVERLRSSTAVLDISGGDSFTDMYGKKRLEAGIQRKILALQLKLPLLLLPQTYGPFNDKRSWQAAAQIVRAAEACWARDQGSFKILVDLLGDAFDATRHRLGVDVAFLLQTRDGSRLRVGLSDGFVGVNISGLIWNNPKVTREKFGFKADYREAVTRIVACLAREVPVVLVPHVLAARGHFESDRDAAEALAEALPYNVRRNVRVSPDPADPCEAKGLMGVCRWFMGTRMHATIAALSSGVPTAAIAYSDKTLGVFETCGQGEHVHDPRTLCTDELVERVLWSFEQREATRASLAVALPPVLTKASEQMDEIARMILNASGKRDGIQRL